MFTFQLFNVSQRRWLTHFGLAAITALSVYIAYLYAPHGDLNYLLTIGCGYLSLILIVLTLLIGPYKLLWRRRNPVNIDLRRDTGIWAGLTGCVHVICGLTLHKGGQIIYYFLEPGPRGLHLLMNPFGFSNDLGLIAVIILVILLVLSNDISLRRLKGKRWKSLQRYNYLLTMLVFIHTFLYQNISQRERPFVILSIALMLVVLVAQAIGFLIFRAHLPILTNTKPNFVLH